MKKSDLKQNMIVETRDGTKFLVFENVPTPYGKQELLFSSYSTYLLGQDYTEDLINRGSSDMSCFDITRVLRWKSFRDLYLLRNGKAPEDEFEVLWERQERVNWQPWELEVLKHIPSYYKEMYKDESGKIYLYREKKGVSRAFGLELDLPSLSSYKCVTPYWLYIDEELKRYNMKREKREENKNEKV